MRGPDDELERADANAPTYDGRRSTAAAPTAEPTAEDLGSMASALGRLAATPMPDRHTARRGTVVDDMYRIEDAIGEGGMGVVYRARDLRLDRAVAIKLGTAVSAAALARARREALALARLSHPNVVVIYQIGEVEGRLYIAMEHVGGGDAREWLRARPRTWREILELYAAAGDGLAAAHAAGFVHRDFKPDNVLVGEDGRPRVGDFGLARELTASGDDRLAAGTIERAPAGGAITHDGAAVGTPGYMAPEQLSGEDLDARADQFAFCVSIWEALFGERPFRGRTPDELADAIERALPHAPDGTDVPPHVVAALRRGLAADREARWPSMGPLLAELRRDPPSVWRRRAIAGAGVAVLAAAIGGVVVAETGGTPAPAPAPAPSRDAPVASRPGELVQLAFTLDASDGNVEGIAPLPGGDILVTGHFFPPFAPRGVPVTGCKPNSRCGFVLRLSADAELRWSRVIGGDDVRLHAPAIAGDRAVVVGETRGTGDVTGARGAGAFAFDLDVTTGEPRWFQRVGWTRSTARNVVLDAAGNAYFTGEIYGAVPDGTTWRPGGAPLGASGYLESFAPNGQARWAIAMPGGREPRFLSIAIAGDTVLWAGAVHQPDLGPQHTVLAGVDAATGAIRWTRRGDGPDNGPEPLAVSPDGVRFAAGGTFLGGLDLGGGVHVDGSPGGDTDAWVAMFDVATGAPRWVREIGGPGYDNLTSMLFDRSGDLWVIGRTGGLSSGAVRTASAMLVARYAPDGTLRWDDLFGDDGHLAKPKALAMGEDGLWIGGSFWRGLSVGRFALTGTGRGTPMIMRLDPARAR